MVWYLQLTIWQVFTLACLQSFSVKITNIFTVYLYSVAVTKPIIYNKTSSSEKSFPCSPKSIDVFVLDCFLLVNRA